VLSRNRFGSGVAALAIVAAAAAGCSSGGSGSAGATTAPTAPPGQLLAAALKNAENVSSYTAAMTIQSSGIPALAALGSGGLTMSGNYSYQRQPSLREFSATSVQAGQLPLGSLDEVTTPTTLYVKMPAITALLHTSKPWVQVPQSELKSGSALSQLLGAAQASDPLSVAQLLAGATNTRTVGTTTLNGVPVTEITGSETGAQAVARLPASLRASLGQSVQKLGLKQISFTGWVDGQQDFRKLVVKETGSSVNESITMNVTSTGKPVSISVPPAGQATTLPASALNGAGL
jgi:hypothetical protein